VPIVQGGITKKTLASTLTGGGGGGGGITNVANVGSIGSGIFRDITGSTINLYNIANAGGIGVSINATDNTIELLNQHVNIADMNDTFFGTLATNDFIRWDGTAWVNSQLKTINSNSIIGSGNISVGDVLIGGNTVASTMMIGTNSNHDFTLESNAIARQTIASDGLVTFNGTSGNAGIVRMRRLDILDSDNVTWRNAMVVSIADNLSIGSGFSNVTVDAALTVTGNITGQAIIQSNTFRNRSAGTLLQVSTLSRAGANTDNIYLKTGDDTSGASLSGSILLDTGTTVGGTRGGVAFFNGNVAPTWNSLQRGIFVGNATAEPTANPTGGAYHWVFGGDVKFRTSGGGLLTLGTNGIKANGGIELNYVAKTSAYTILNSDYIVDCTSGTFAVTLPTAVGIAGKMFIVKNSGAGVITIATTSSQTIDGTLTIVANQWDSFQFTSNGSNWIITGSF